MSSSARSAAFYYLEKVIVRQGGKCQFFFCSISAAISRVLGLNDVCFPKDATSPKISGIFARLSGSLVRGQGALQRSTVAGYPSGNAVRQRRQEKNGALIQKVSKK